VLPAGRAREPDTETLTWPRIVERTTRSPLFGLLQVSFLCAYGKLLTIVKGRSWVAKAQHAWSACILGVALALCGPDCWAQLRSQSHGFDPSPLQSTLPKDAPRTETVSAAARGPEAWKLGPFPDSPGLTAVADWLKPASERRDSETHLLVIEAKGFREASGHCATGEDINRVIAAYRDDINLRVVMLIQDCIVRGTTVRLKNEQIQLLSVVGLFSCGLIAREGA